MPPADLLAALRRARTTAPEALEHTLAHWQLRPLTGGRNNHVYARTSPDGAPTCIKIYKADDRRRAHREWAALTLLAEHHADLAPAPLWLDDTTDQPAIGMSLLPGTPIPQGDDPTAALKGLAHATHRLQAVPLTGALARLERIDSISHYIARLTDIWPAQLADHPDDPRTADMLALLHAWHDNGDATTLAEPAPPVFSRGDSNLDNWLRHGSTTRCVDFEYAGHSDTAADAADLTEHISARAIPDEQWETLLPDLGINRTNEHRYRAAQRTCALRWLAVLWKQRNTRHDEFEDQLTRVRQLLKPSNSRQSHRA